MTTNQIQVGSKIQRISNNYTGDVIEIDSINRRARIVWGEGMPRTWIRFADLLVIAETKPTLTSFLSPFDAYLEKIASNYDEIGEYIAKK